MQAMQDENCTQQFQQVFQLNKSTDDMVFDQIISQLQEIVINHQFQISLTNFMKENWTALTDNCKKDKELQIFNQYSRQVKTYLQNNIRKKVPEFEWSKFNLLFKTRKNIVDQQISDTLHSLQDLQHFKSFIKDYRNSFEEQEMFKVLTIKSNKLNEYKKVKGKSNIFSQNQNQYDLFDKGIKGSVIKRKPAQQKTEEELLVPNLILTVKPLRKK